jgi:hypothetical protein|tara:strand:+ start:76 stop:285 length:210 start_codon:yes stop_codon:yes gene_type:complete
MQELDQLARSLVKNPEDALLVCAALMAVTRQHYVEELGSEQTSFIFQSVVESFDFMTALEQEFKQHTIH